MKRIIICFIIIPVIILIIGFYIFLNNIKNNESVSLVSEKNKEIEELKKDIGAVGESDIYEIQHDIYDGKSVLNIKADLKYKVAFAGMIRKAMPDINQVEEIYSNNYPKKNGIWIEESSRKIILQLLNNSNIFLCKYKIDEEGYLTIEQEETINENDRKIIDFLSSGKQSLVFISSICYIIDEITGNVLEYCFEDIDKYQTYEYFEDENKKIIFVTENKHKQLDEIEIINSVLELL